jgi:hypothetical protein
MRPALPFVLGLTVTASLTSARPGWALERGGFGMSVLVDGDPRSELFGRGKVYIEALRGKEYTLRLTNPLDCRVAVALAVDGLNTIDAQHTAPAQARKWVLGPHETLEISGWQVSSDHARRFYFTGERESYGAWLGKTDDLGVIEAVFFRERRQPVLTYSEEAEVDKRERARRDGPSAHGGAVPAPSAAAPNEAAADSKAKAEGRLSKEQREALKGLGYLSDESAATGIGDRTDHRVYQVWLDLESSPAAVVSIRYEFRPQLVRLGLLPAHPRRPIDRRESARGFEGPYCPEP